MPETTRLRSVDDQPRFEAGDETTDRGHLPPGGGERDTPRGVAKGRADLALPTDRLRFDNQLKILQSVADMSGTSRRGSTAEEMSAAIDIKGGTGGLNSRFFRAAGWFESVGRGKYTASDGLLAYRRHIHIAPDELFEATAEMRAEVRNSWFWKELEQTLEGGQPIAQRVALLQLAKASNANNHTVQLETIVDWLAWVGLITKDDGMIRLKSQDGFKNPQQDTADTAKAQDIAPDDEGVDLAAEDQPASGEEQSTSTPGRTVDAEALVSFNLSVRITADDMKSMSDEQMQFLMNFAEKLRG